MTVPQTPSQWTSPSDMPVGPAPGLRYASLAERALATIVDYVVVVIVGGVPYALIGAGKANAEPMLRNVGSVIVLVAFFAVYGWILNTWNGQTIGGRLLGLRIVRRRDGGPLSILQATIRPIGVLITAAFFYLSLFAVLIGREKRTPADALTGAVVVKRLKNAGSPIPDSPLAT